MGEASASVRGMMSGSVEHEGEWIWIQSYLGIISRNLAISDTEAGTSIRVWAFSFSITREAGEAYARDRQSNRHDPRQYINH